MTPDLSVHIKLKRKLLPALVALLIGLQLATPYGGWVALLVGLSGAWLISYLWARSLARGLRFRREMRFSWKHVGDKLLERHTLTNDGWAPAAWVEILDSSNLPNFRGSRALSISGHRSLRWHREVACTRRGLFTLGPTELRTGDPFGIYEVRVHDPLTASLLIIPPIIELPHIEVAPGGRLGDGRPTVNALELTVSASRVGEYVSGDSLRWIHWPTSARRDELYVRLFDATPSGDLWIVLDLDQEVQAGKEENSTEEHAIILAASLAERALRSGRPVGLVAVAGQQGWAWLPPRSDEGQRREILRSLAMADPGPVTLGQLLSRLRTSIRGSPSLILITPASQGDWLKSLLPLIQQGAVATALLLDPSSFGGPGEVGVAAELLTQAGIDHFVIRRELLDSAEQKPEMKLPRSQIGQDPWRALA